MDMNSISTATLDPGGGALVSFGSGNEGGRLQARAAGRGATANASSREVSAVRRRVNSSGLTRRQRDQLIRMIDANRNNRGNIRRGILRDIADQLAVLT